MENDLLERLEKALAKLDVLANTRPLDNNRLLTATEVQEIYGINYKTVKQMFDEGVVPVVYQGTGLTSPRKTRKSDMDKYINNLFKQTRFQDSFFSR